MKDAKPVPSKKKKVSTKRTASPKRSVSKRAAAPKTGSKKKKKKTTKQVQDLLKKVQAFPAADTSEELDGITLPEPISTDLVPTKFFVITIQKNEEAKLTRLDRGQGGPMNHKILRDPTTGRLRVNVNINVAVGDEICPKLFVRNGNFLLDADDTSDLTLLLDEDFSPIPVPVPPPFRTLVTQEYKTTQGGTWLLTFQVFTGPLALQTALTRVEYVPESPDKTTDGFAELLPRIAREFKQPQDVDDASVPMDEPEVCFCFWLIVAYRVLSAGQERAGCQ